MGGFNTDIIIKIWEHSGIRGAVWVPHISDIGSSRPYFNEGDYTLSTKPKFPDFTTDQDWYFTPGVARAKTRKASSYASQRALWVDCDGDYDRDMLFELKPTFVWETSPGNLQAVWLMDDLVDTGEYNKNGLQGLITQAIGADASGVDIGQLLRVPGSTHNKREPFQGNVILDNGPISSRKQVITRVAKALGFKPGLAAIIGTDGRVDRSKSHWKVAREAAELGLEETLTFKLIKSASWNKWPDEPELLREDIAKAYSQGVGLPESKSPLEGATRTTVVQLGEEDEEEEVTFTPYPLSRVSEFGPMIRKPVEWILPGIIPESGCGVIVSAPKVGKTRVSMEIALGIATGVSPLGLRIPKARNVGFFSLEDGHYLYASRLNDYINTDLKRLGYHWEGHVTESMEWLPPQDMNLLVGFDPINLHTPQGVAQVQDVIRENKLSFVVIDTMSMAMGSADVSNSKDIYDFLKPLKVIAKAEKCAIMLIHHTRKRVFEKGETIQEMILGSTGIHGWSDFIMGLLAPKEGSTLLEMKIQTKRKGNHTKFIDESMKFTQVV